MSNQTVVIAAGGTGGHVFPALAVAAVLRERDIPVVWVGSESGLENKVVPKSGIPLRNIAVSPLRGGGILRKPVGAINLIKAIVSSLKIVREEKAGTVLGMGGYVSGPVCLAAKMSGRRMVVHEQNAVPGFTNRILKRFADTVLEAIPDTFTNAICTGNPVRKELLLVAPPETRYAERSGPLRVLVIGGSQGAKSLNEIVPKALALIEEPLEVIHQCGPKWLTDTKTLYQPLAHQNQVKDFIEDMAEVYGWADIIICRSGAMTVAEIAAVGLAAILIPYPAAVDDHQTANGSFLVEAGAALMVQEAVMSSQQLAADLRSLDRSKLQVMAESARNVSKRNATERVVAELTGVAA